MPTQSTRRSAALRTLLDLAILLVMILGEVVIEELSWVVKMGLIPGYL
jgi:preprotein translocase subunit SecF